MSWPKGKPHSPETRAAMSRAQTGHSVSVETRKRMSDAQRGRIISEDALRKHAEAMADPVVREKISIAKQNQSEETRRAISKALTGHPVPDAQKDRISKGIKEAWQRKGENPSKNFLGGPFVDCLATVLIPAGFVREYHIVYGPGPGQAYRLDFAHISGHICIECDGPGHANTKEYDARRDAFLRNLGWKVIRVKHD